MGAWGTGMFEDDTACDLLYDVMEADAKSFIEAAADRNHSDDLEYDECQEILVAGAILDSLLNGSDHGAVAEGYEEWIAAQDSNGLEGLAPAIAAGLKAVISDDSELNELWQENEEDYPAWKASIEKLIASLEGVSAQSS